MYTFEACMMAIDGSGFGDGAGDKTAFWENCYANIPKKYGIYAILFKALHNTEHDYWLGVEWHDIVIQLISVLVSFLYAWKRWLST